MSPCSHEAAPASGEPGWPRPLTLLCALLRGEGGVAAAGMAPAGWDSFTELVIARHRVAPAIARAVAACAMALPGPVEQAIAAEARANGFAALAQRAESLKLAARLRATGAEPVFLKGWPLAEQLCGAPGLRHSSDIDLLVDADQRIAAAGCLAEAGYLPAEEHLLRGRLIATGAVRGECKDVQFCHPETGLVVELHWRTSHFRHWPELSDLGEPPVTLPGIPAPDRILVPGPLGQLVYLAEHGRQHLFGRLKWLLDIAQLARARGAGRLGADLAAAEAAGAGRAVRLALHLAGRVFAAPVPEAALVLPPREARWAGEMLAGIADPEMSFGRPKARLAFYRLHLTMAESPAQALGVLRYAFWRPLRLGLARLTHPGDRA